MARKASHPSTTRPAPSRTLPRIELTAAQADPETTPTRMNAVAQRPQPSVVSAMWMVTKRTPWYRNKLTSVFGGVRAIEQSSYFVFEAQKRRYSYAAGRKGS